MLRLQIVKTQLSHCLFDFFFCWVKVFILRRCHPSC